MSEQQALSITQQLKHALATINRISDELANANVTDNNVIKGLLRNIEFSANAAQLIGVEPW
ncbi:hypothetical protein [Cysteiniphilum marinum]|uniref:hypothetical protein n=1 Tax=Cysteiniphilum marinum TaxID=2774191 RepID=UPI00193AB381|nr:hypothetical protein [Cysteiniphilum marinum]